MSFVKRVEFHVLEKYKVQNSANISIISLPWLTTIHILLNYFYINNTKIEQTQQIISTNFNKMCQVRNSL